MACCNRGGEGFAENIGFRVGQIDGITILASKITSAMEIQSGDDRKAQRSPTFGR